MVRVRVEWTGQHQRAFLLDRLADNGAEVVVGDLGWVVTAHRDDVPVAYRDHPAVIRWFAERDEGIHAVPDHEVDDTLRDLETALLGARRGLVEDLVYDVTSRYGLPAFVERLLTPMLRDVGERWRRGDVRVTTEHFLTNGLRAALMVVRGPTPPPPRRRDPVADVFLYGAPGEGHTFGVEVLSMRLTDAGHRTKALAGGAPQHHIVEEATIFRPNLVLCSVTRTTCLPAALESASAMAEALPTAHVIVGGHGLQGVPPRVPDGVHVVVDATTTDALLIADAVARREACPIYAV